ncbi:C-C motif chemokine 3-like [Hypomesus transpacificus]|uniref:C-C motif chemokine 3-like n=1 Tax=Hypomesus transpacificus TaxID=137520 RepID=UPI001F087C0A|nr:C-C motif chemokine 3-like [Hypomesus transpacificus]
MSASRLSLLPVVFLLMGAITLSQGFRVTAPKKCCFSFITSQPKHPVVSFTRTSQHCSTPAVLLKTNTGRQLCARPSDSWVVKTINFLDNKNTGNKTPLQ